MHFLCRADGSEAARTGWFCSDLGGEELLVLPLPSQSSNRIDKASYLPPSGDNVELRGIEPLTPSMPWKCSTN